MSDRDTCASPNCDKPAAYRTRTKAAYCLACIDNFYSDVGVLPLEPFVGVRKRRLTSCKTCGTQLAYSLDMVFYALNGSSRRCDWCNLERTGKVFRVGAISLDEASLGSSDPRELTGGELLEFIERRVWPRERIIAHFGSLHMECVRLPPGQSDGFDPVHVRCVKCGTETVHLPGRMTGNTQHGWCACDQCGGGKGPCPEDIARAFEWHGLRIQDRSDVSVQRKLLASCIRCGGARLASLEQLRHDAVPCYVCDGAADPTAPHRVYLFRFEAHGCYKVGITTANNDERLNEHARRGGILLEVVRVPNRAAAFALEARVLAAMAAYPAPVGREEFPQSGWTETWSFQAPDISLAELEPSVRAVRVPPSVVRDWEEYRAGTTVIVDTIDQPGITLRAGNIVVFTWANAAPRSSWRRRAENCGLQIRPAVSPLTTVLVCDDPTMQTQKVRAARAFGTAIIRYEEFAQLMGEMPAVG